MTAFIYLLPGAIVGAVVSYSLPYIIRVLPYLARTFRNPHVIEGNWYSYHCTRHSNQPKVRQMRWKIKRSINGSFRAVCWDDSESEEKRHPLHGSGRAFLERGQLVIEIFLRKDQAHVTFRILEPIATNEISAGLWLSFNLDGTLAAGPIVFTRDKLPLDSSTALLKMRISTDSSNKLLEVPTRQTTRKKHSS